MEYEDAYNALHTHSHPGHTQSIFVFLLHETFLSLEAFMNMVFCFAYLLGFLLHLRPVNQYVWALIAMRT